MITITAHSSCVHLVVTLLNVNMSLTVDCRPGAGHELILMFNTGFIIHTNHYYHQQQRFCS